MKYVDDRGKSAAGLSRVDGWLSHREYKTKEERKSETVASFFPACFVVPFLTGVGVSLAWFILEVKPLDGWTALAVLAPISVVIAMLMVGLPMAVFKPLLGRDTKARLQVFLGTSAMAIPTLFLLLGVANKALDSSPEVVHEVLLHDVERRSSSIGKTAYWAEIASWRKGEGKTKILVNAHAMHGLKRAKEMAPGEPVHIRVNLREGFFGLEYLNTWEVIAPHISERR